MSKETVVVRGEVDIEARKRLFQQAQMVFNVARDILADSNPRDMQQATRVLSTLEEDAVSQSSGWAWEVWHRLCAEHPSLVTDEVTFRKGVCGTQAHHWIELSDGEYDQYIVDVAPPDIYSGPLLIGPRSPLRLVYGLKD